MGYIGYIAAALCGYFLGSIPTGYLVGRLKGIDIRAVGSGNIGATNVFRTLGKTAGLFVMLADAAKGLAACWGAGRLGASLDQAAPASLEIYMIVGGVAAILGHNYTCWLRFKGGKGIATSAGVLLALFPKALAAAFVVWLLVFALSRYVSLASICAALVLPVAAWAFRASPTLVGVAVGLSALAIFKHRANIQRLRAGTEHRIGRAAADKTTP